MVHFGLIGKNLSHSLSEAYFNKKFDALKLSDYQYNTYDIAHIGEITEIIKNNTHLKGFNITIPYKTAILNYVDEIDDEVQKIGATNTIKIYRQKDNTIKTKAFNTDHLGFRDSLSAHKNLETCKALILGTGGAAQAVAFALTKLNIEFLFVTRKKKSIPASVQYHELTENIITQHTLIINATPLGMYPHADTMPDIPYRYIGEKHFLFDLVYNPSLTLFLKKGLEQNAYICNGLNMLYAQAEYSWKIWMDESL